MPEIKLFKLNRNAVFRELKEYAKKNIEKGALAVILVGSLARGDYTAYSDADIIIIVKDSKDRPIDRITKYLEPKASIDIEPRVYTLKEIQAMIENETRIIEEIAKNGILLAGDQELIKQIKQRYQK
ncbi:nucleotidyltransferase domain-containing protein [Candidatus Bathyarchaeota archaeon]|nr:nucleotidyltransferase domain-containing protein [Candidatus Bathyarchaeota archaeon]